MTGEMPLPAPAPMTAPRVSIVGAMAATVGARESQEDTARLGLDGGTGPMAVLADGMGGHANGALASKLVCEAFEHGFATAPPDNPRQRLLLALESANNALADEIAAQPLLSGMGSTLVAVTIEDHGLIWLSVGDSPLLLWRRGELVQLNEDHSLAPDLDRMAAAGLMTLEAAARDPRRHMLRSAVVGEDIDLIDVPERALTLEHGDVVLLASDGLETLDSDEIARIVGGYVGDGAAAVADALIRSVENQRDVHQDNATVIVLIAAAA